MLEAVLFQINLNARIVICGSISNYASEEMPVGPRNLSALIIQRARMEGFLVLDYLDRMDEAIQELSKWLMEGNIQHREDIQEGITSFTEKRQPKYQGK